MAVRVLYIVSCAAYSEEGAQLKWRSRGGGSLQPPIFSVVMKTYDYGLYDEQFHYLTFPIQ